MIARLLSSVFYIITRKLLGAFYVDQKKKGLLPSTLPSEHESEHEQWIYADITSSANTIHYPITMSRTLTAIAVDIEPEPRLVTPIGISTWSGSTLTVAPVDYHAITIWVIGV